MRSSILSFPALLVVVATFLLIAENPFGSPTVPTGHDRHENLIDAPSAPARSPDTPDFQVVSSMAARDGDSRHLQRRTDVLNPSDHPSLALMQRHNHVKGRLQLHSVGSSPAKRSLAGDLSVMGFQLIWDHADVIVSSSLAYYRTTEYYKNITILLGGEFRFGPTVQNFMITYGYFRLMFSPMVNVAADAAAEMARAFPDGFGQFIREFAETMLVIPFGLIVGTYAVLAFSVRLSIWITMEIVHNAQLHDMVIGG